MNSQGPFEAPGYIAFHGETVLVYQSLVRFLSMRSGLSIFSKIPIPAIWPNEPTVESVFPFAKLGQLLYSLDHKRVAGIPVERLHI